MITFFGLALVTQSCSAGDDKLQNEMVGTFKGSAKIVVDWTKQRNLDVHLIVGVDGSVTGKIGDATLKKGQLSKNRGALGRTLKIKTDYLVTGELEGALIAAESVTRKSVSMPLNFKNGVFSGGVHTDGRKLGVGGDRKLSAAGLKLSKQVVK